jgi:CheY-like chemotaxis protein/anti-sigma regulatory factor (Ser/Thr protein kinase)
MARDVVDRQVTLLARLVDELLDVSRMTEGKISLKRTPQDLGRIVAQGADTARPLAEARRQKLALELPAGPVWISGDAERLSQVVANLLNNACKYTQEGGRIEVSASAAEGEALIRVRDNGQGIDAKLLPRVFDLFVQGERSLDRGQGGLGIGLTLVRRLVEMHQGSVTASSAGPGQGSVFTVRLPLAAADAAPAAVAPARARVRVPASVRRRVLVVDDNVDGADSLALVLQQAGHEAVVVYDGRAALAEAAQSAFDVVLLDLGLPEGLDGYEVARRLRAAAPGAVPVLVALTGFGQEEDQRRTRAAGFARHLVKPVDPEELQRVIQNL